MEKITSEAFFNAWVQTAKNRESLLKKIWREKTNFTNQVKGSDSSIMKEIADKLGLLCYHGDYYCIDTVLYKKEDLALGPKAGNYWLRDMRVAFEHENDFNGVYQEISHLLLTNCDLKVLVTYPNNEFEDEAQYLHEIIEGNRMSKVLSDEESFLIIIGSEGDLFWEGYVYKESGYNKMGWKQLVNLHQTRNIPANR
jgi:hypothetical protein